MVFEYVKPMDRDIDLRLTIGALAILLERMTDVGEMPSGDYRLYSTASIANDLL